MTASEWIVVGLGRASIGLAASALAVAACVRLLRPQSPRAEQWAWMLVLVQGVVLVPYGVPIPSGFGEVAPAPRPVAVEAGPARASVEVGGDKEGGDPGRARSPRSDPIIGRQPEPIAATRPAEAVRSSWSFLALTAWLAGVGMWLGIGSVRHAFFAARLRQARPAGPEWQAEWRRVLDGRGVGASIPLLVSADIGPALCWSSAGHCLVVPGSLWDVLPPRERGAILRHELEHFRRCDLWTTLLARGLAALHWFNPAAWWAVARFEAQSEFLCDRAAMPDDPSAFAAMLLRLGSADRDRMALARAARAGSLFERIRRLLTETSRPSRWRCALPIAVAVAALAMTGVRPRAAGGPGPGAEDRRQSTNSPGPPLPPRALARLGSDDLRTRNWIIDIAFSPDGRRIAAAEPNTDFPRISLFDLRSPRRIETIAPAVDPKGWVYSLAFSPDGTKILWGEMMGWVGLWDLSANRPVFRERFHGGKGLVNNVIEDEAAYSGTVHDVAFSPDGRLVASASVDGIVRLRRVEKPTESYRDFEAPRSPTGRRNRLPLGGPPPAPRPGLESARGLAFTPDGTRLVVASATVLSVWRIEDGRLLRRIERAHGDRPGATDGQVDSLAVTPDGRFILSSGSCSIPPDRTSLKGLPKEVVGVGLSEVRLWDIETGERVRELDAGDHEGLGYAALSRDGRRVAVSGGESLRMLDVATGRVEWTIALPGRGDARPAFSPDGSIVAQGIDRTIGLFDAKTGRILDDDARMPRGEPASAAWSPAGDRLVVGYRDGGVRVWDAARGELIWLEFLNPARAPYNDVFVPNFVAFTRDGRSVVAAGGALNGSGKLAIYRADSGLRVREVDQPAITEAALSPDGRIVVASSPNGSHMYKRLRGIEIETGRTRWTSPPEGEQRGWRDLRWMQFRPDSSLLEVAQGGGELTRLNALTGREVRRSKVEVRPREPPRPGLAGRRAPSSFRTAAYSPDGRTLASFVQKVISIWDVEAGTLRQTIPHPFGSGAIMAISPDGKRLATSVRDFEEPASEDRIRLFDIDTGEPAITLETPGDRAVALAFSPDGTRLFSGFHRGTSIVWDVRRGRGTPGAQR